jgi:predicted ATPase
MRGHRLSSFANSTLASSSPGPRSRVSRKESPGNFAPLSMARLWRDQGKRQEARELLAPVYSWFTEGFDTRDLRDAKELLSDLIDTSASA